MSELPKRLEEWNTHKTGETRCLNDTMTHLREDLSLRQTVIQKKRAQKNSRMTGNLPQVLQGKIWSISAVSPQNELKLTWHRKLVSGSQEWKSSKNEILERSSTMKWKIQGVYQTFSIWITRRLGNAIQYANQTTDERYHKHWLLISGKISIETFFYHQHHP